MKEFKIQDFVNAPKSVLRQLQTANANIPLTELPDISKKVSVEIDSSIGDSEILAIVAALVQSSQSSLIKHAMLCHIKHVKQTLHYSLNVIAPESMLRRGLEELLTLSADCPITFDRNHEGADYHQVLTRDHIYSLAQPSGRAFAQAAAILIGAEANSLFDLKKYVDAKGITKQFDNIATVIDLHFQLDSVFGKEVSKFCDTHGLVIECESTLGWQNTYHDMLQQVVDSQIVIGPLSFYTYAAACLEIPTVEIFKTRDDINIFSKWSSFKYAAVLQEEIEHFRASRLDKAWLHWSGVDVNRQNILLPADG